MASTSYQVQGMTCDHCVRAVRSEIGQIPGVADVAVDLHTGRVTVSTDRPIDNDAVVAAVDEAGYEVVGG
jgi:copper ion binding protein